MRFVVLLFTFFTLLFSFEVEDIKASATTVANGKTIFLEFKKRNEREYKKVTVGKKEFKVFSNPFDTTRSYALVPFSYYEKLETKKLEIEYKEGKKLQFKEIFLDVINGNYLKEEIQVSSKKVNPKSKEVKQRISKEYNEAMKIYTTVTPNSYIKEPFILPLESKITSAFGKARVYNGSLKGYHSGTDFRAKMGTPIIASNDAEVALVQKRFYSGGTVLLNHGQGIYTCYFHMSEFRVKKGDSVNRGDLLGLSGKSGSVTGPHLHFSARINGVQVDPLQLIELLNKNLLKRK